MVRKEVEKREVGKRRTMWLPSELDERAEETRRLLGLGRSGFYRFCVVEVIKQVVVAKTSAIANP